MKTSIQPLAWLAMLSLFRCAKKADPGPSTLTGIEPSSVGNCMQNLVLPFYIVLLSTFLAPQSAWGQNWQWAVQGGGIYSAQGQKVAIDVAGNIYITGYFSGTATFGSITLTSAGNSDIFVAKLSANGIFQWAQRAGGTNDEGGTDIAVDRSGNVIVAGSFGSEKATFGAITIDNFDQRGHHDIFVAKLSSSGSWQWVEKAGDTIEDRNASVAVDANSNIILTGSFSGTKIIFGPYTMESSDGNQDLYVAKLSPSGIWQWIEKGEAGTGGTIAGTDVAVDQNGNIAVIGFFTSKSVIFGTTTLKNTSTNGFSDVFIARLSSSGSWQWARQVSDSDSYRDYNNSVATDQHGNIVVTGAFTGSAVFGTTTLMQTGPGSNIYVARLSQAGTWQWAEQAGGNDSNCQVHDVAVDGSGNVVVTGYASARSLAIGKTSIITSSNFVARLNATGTWQQAIGISGGAGYGVTVAANGDTFVTGGFGAGIATFGSITLTSNGGLNAFIAALKWGPTPLQLNAYHLQQSGEFTKRTVLDYQAVGAIKIAADYSEGTLFKVTRSNAQHLTLHIRENASNTSSLNVAHATGFLTVKNYSDSVVAVYHHPSFVHPEYRQQGFHLDVVDTSDPSAGTILASYPIRVVQPPLMLVHGLWSTGAAAFPGLKTNLIEAGLFEKEARIRYADYANDRAFADNAYRFIQHKNALLAAYAEEHISASKIDIIAHSMGGLLARQYIQDDETYGQDVNKLITLNTPHSGSQMANFLVLLPPPATSALALTGHDPTAGAVADLRYDSPAIKRLNSNPDTKGVAVHALTTNITLNPLLPLQSLINGQYDYGGFIAGWAALTNPRETNDINTFLRRDVFNHFHDLIVGLDSQQGGVIDTTRYATNFSGQWHGSGGTPAVQEKMIELLRENSYSNSELNHFTRSGFHPITIQSTFPNSLLPLPDPVTTSVIDILTPTRNTLLTDVDSIQVSVAGSEDVTRILLLSGANAQEVSTQLIEGSRGMAYIRMPKGSIGRFHLTAFAFAGNRYVNYDTLSVGLATRATLTSVRIEPRLVYTAQNDSTLIRLLGSYSDGIERSISELQGANFTFSNGRAQISPGGWVAGRTTGQDFLKVVYQGKVDSVEVDVAGPIARPILPMITSFTPANGPVGTSVTISGSNLRGTTAVSFNTTRTTDFMVDSSGKTLTVSVPLGATTGPITVTTPTESVSSATPFTVTEPLATANTLPKANIIVYPNPARSYFFITTPPGVGIGHLEVSLTTLLGQPVHSQLVPVLGTGTRIFVNTTGLSKGVYTLSLRARSFSIFKRIAVE